MKVITICCSLKFEEDIKFWTEKLTSQGNCILSIIYPINTDLSVYTPEQRNIFAKV